MMGWKIGGQARFTRAKTRELKLRLGWENLESRAGGGVAE